MKCCVGFSCKRDKLLKRVMGEVNILQKFHFLLYQMAQLIAVPRKLRLRLWF